MPRLSNKAGPEEGPPPQEPIEAPPPRGRAAPDPLGFGNLDDQDDFLRVLLYGREGTSKTTSLAASANIAPEGSRVLVINAEGGLKLAALRKRGVDTRRIVVWPDPRSGVQITARTLERLHERLLSDLMTDPGSWYLVGFDSLTEVYQATVEQATDKRVAKLRKAAADEDEVDPDFIDRDDYGVMTNQLRRVIRRFRDLPCHLVLTALERTDDGVVGPALSGALAGSVLGYVDLTLYLRATQHAAGEDEDAALAEFRALTRPGKASRAKDRFDLLPRVLVEPTFPRILGYVRGELEESTDPAQVAYVERRRAEQAAEAAAKAEKEARRAAARKGTKQKGTDDAEAA